MRDNASNTFTTDGESGGPSQLTRQERFVALADEFVVAPFRIMWDDLRARIGLFLLGLFVLMGTVGVLVVEVPHPNEGPAYVKPFVNPEFILGTGKTGQDIFAQIVHSTPAMFQMILAGALFSTVMGTTVGTVSGYVGGWVDTVLSTITDIVVTIPGLPLIIVLGALINPENPYVVGVLLTANVWAGVARAIRSQVLTLRHAEYVEASQAMGLSTRYSIFSDILPNIMPYVTVKFANSARFVIYSSVGLYFLGVLPFSTQNWGVMMNLAYNTGGIYLGIGLHWLFFPMLAIVLLILAFIFVAQGLDRVFNPRARARHVDKVPGDDEKSGGDGSSGPQVMEEF
ncbi:ABC transporter permease [Halococcus agarilyticus]|uniref:ABC transporter permease n=1 Tax=Halococcus agarilyticus TaxID=1232219 RepID=UPI0006780194|nr:ABC transporter permease [Halococcus agarilyticus]